MRRVLCSLLLFALSICPKLALADPFLLSVQGTLDQGSVSGTIQVLANGSFDPVDLTVLYNGATYQFNGPYNEGQFTKTDGSTGLYVIFYNQSEDQLNLEFPVPSLLDYTGGLLCSLSNPCSALGDSYFAFYGLGIHRRPLETVTATVSTTPIPTPEPESLVLVGMGLACLWFGVARVGRKVPLIS